MPTSGSGGGGGVIDLVPGRRYRVKFGDCCIAGEFTATYIGPGDLLFDDVPIGQRFDTAYIEGGFDAQEVIGDD
jgi:hypothetical protein